MIKSSVLKRLESALRREISVSETSKTKLFRFFSVSNKIFIAELRSQNTDSISRLWLICLYVCHSWIVPQFRTAKFYFIGFSYMPKLERRWGEAEQEKQVRQGKREK